MIAARPFYYQQASGKMYHGNPADADSILVGTGYSGFGAGLNNPSKEGVRTVGPIPRGEYEIGPIYDTNGHMGPRVMPLTPMYHDALGRSGFFIHGDNGHGTASHGCICLDRVARGYIGSSGDKQLFVW